MLVWGMTLILGGCSTEIPTSLMGSWHMRQFMPMVGTSQPPYITTASGSQTSSEHSATHAGNPASSTAKSKESGGSDKIQQQTPSSQQKPSILVPENPDKDNGQVIVAYKSKIEETQSLIRTINESQLTKEQHDTLISINSFLEKAQEAFSQDDMPMAVNLAEKAHTLTKEIVKNSTQP